MQLGVFGSKVPPTRMACGGWTGCEELHTFFDPGDVVVLVEAQSLDDMCEEHTSQERIDKAVADRTIMYFPEKRAVIPTILGMWYEDCAVN